MTNAELDDRIEVLEQAVLSQRGIQARAEEDADDTRSAAIQIEGRLLEAIDYTAVLDAEDVDDETEE